MCKIIITDRGPSRKSCPESFARPHPTPLPPPFPIPIPLSLPSAVPRIAPLPATLQKAKQEREAQERIAKDKRIHKPVVHQPKTTAHSPKTNIPAPKNIAHTPNTSAHTAKASTQVKAPKIVQAQYKSIQKPIAKEIAKEQNAASKSSEQEKPVLTAHASGGNNSGNKKAQERRDGSTTQNRLPERRELKNSNPDESETTPERIRRTRTNSPSPNAPLLRNVRFAIDKNQRTRSTTSSSSTSSGGSFIDPYPVHTLPNPDVTRKQPASTRSSPTSIPSYWANMEERDSMDSDISSNIDAGDALRSIAPGLDTEYFRDPGAAWPQSHNMRDGLSYGDGNAASSGQHAAQYDHMSVLEQSPKDPSYQLMPEQEWDSMSDQESAIDCSDTIQSPMSDQDINTWNWMQGQSIHENSGFSAWLKSLGTSPRVKKSSQTSSSPKGLREPIFVYRTESERLAKTKKGPLLAIPKSSLSDGNHHGHKSGHLQSELERMEEPEIIQAPSNPLHTSPSPVDVAEEAIRYDPGLQIFWRDV